jgi:hypothetical protein
VASSTSALSLFSDVNSAVEGLFSGLGNNFNSLNNNNPNPAGQGSGLRV